MTISNQRYKIAQNAEKAYWEKYKHEYCKSEGLSHNFWQHHINLLKRYADFSIDMKILDIGCGPYGLINYLPAGEKYGLDPLMDYYITNFNMPKNIHWLSGHGENIPFENEFFDLLISTNTIEHTRNPEVVLREMNRVMKPGAALFFTVYTRPHWARLVMAFFEKIGEGDPPHPYSFHINGVKKLLETSGFSVIDISKEKETLGNVVKVGRSIGKIPLKLRNKISSTLKLIKEGNIKKLFTAFLGLLFLRVFNTGLRLPNDHSVFVAIKKYG